MEITYHSDERVLTIKGDEKVVEKATLGNGNIDAKLTSIEGVSVNALNLAMLYDKAESTGPLYDANDELAGYPKAKSYVAFKQKFIRQQELIAEEHAKPKVSHAPAITARATIPVNAD